MARVKKIVCEGTVMKVGYNMQAQTVLYVSSKENESFGIVTKILPKGTPYEYYDPSKNQELLKKVVEFSYTGIEKESNVLNGVEFIGFKEEQ